MNRAATDFYFKPVSTWALRKSAAAGHSCRKRVGKRGRGAHAGAARHLRGDGALGERPGDS
eukprot:6488846-Pyramimonas_sp.AAC.1